MSIAAETEDEAASIATDIEGRGADQIDVRHDGAGFFPIPVFGALVVGYMGLAGFIAWLKNWSDTRRRDGVLIQVTQDGEIKTQSLSIPYGQVVLVTKDGQWLRYENANDEGALSELISNLVKGLVPSGGTPTSPANVGAAEGEASGQDGNGTDDS